VPAALALLNAGEWRIHRDLLHRRTPPLRLLYDRHTPHHHMIFVTDDMAIRSPRVFRLVLIPFYGVLAAGLATLPIPLRLRRHHAVHQAPELMQKWNFNVTLPLWDLVRGTVYRGRG
jgi:hypothetical protein